MLDLSGCLALLARWAEHAERHWYTMPDKADLGCYGTGYNYWGVQTNQKYVAAMAALCTLSRDDPAVPETLRELALRRALAALRFSLRSHVSGDYHCTDGTQWGHTWISALGIERMMYGLGLLEPYLSDADHDSLKRVLTSEAEWLLYHHRRGDHEGIFADPWNHSGKNAPESNLWNGALLWRAAMMYPDHPHAADWQEQAHLFLINSVSVTADANDERVVAGRPIKERHVGANFFPHYALDHHGYLNVGYMVICLSNAAMLHFDMKAKGWPVPESLYHHHADLWQVLRKMIFSNGRLARIGGDSRVRYAYCQEYLLPTLAYAADCLGEPYAEQLIEGQISLIQEEAAYNGDGSFYGRRLAFLAELSPYYYTRLESDRACVLGMLLAYWPHVSAANTPSGSHNTIQPWKAAFEASVAGGWCEPEHGAVLHRTPTRLASFAWRAHGLAQGLCQPPDDGHLAEWQQNLGGYIRFLGDPGFLRGAQPEHRRLGPYRVQEFDGGFVTCGSVLEGVDVVLEEGWRGAVCAEHQIAFAALPDGHTVVGLQYCRTANHRTYVAEVKGLHLNVPNDLYTGHQRTLITTNGELILRSPADRAEIVDLQSPWANVEGRIGVVRLYGPKHLALHRVPERRGGRLRSLFVEEICLDCRIGTCALDPNTLLLDVGWAVLSDANPIDTARFCAQAAPLLGDEHSLPLRAVRVQGLDGHVYVVLANFGPQPASCALKKLIGTAKQALDLASGETIAGDQDESFSVAPGTAHVLALP